MVLGFALVFSLKMEVPDDKEGAELKAYAEELKPTLEVDKPVILSTDKKVNTVYLSYLLKRNVVVE